MRMPVDDILGALKEIGISYLPLLGLGTGYMREMAQYHIRTMGMCDPNNPSDKYLSEVGHSQKAYDIWQEECHKYINR
ncbi:MAG: hypothetical protein GC134_01765 [Proteobacteria bacterium]|nr:hypothetical protein [Pseudomonadota bacterium]